MIRVLCIETLYEKIGQLRSDAPFNELLLLCPNQIEV